MYAYGKNVLKEAKASSIQKAYISKDEYIEFLVRNKIKFEKVKKEKLDSLVSGNHQGIVLKLYDYEYYNLQDIESDFVVILDHIEDVHNLGSIIRTCACAGVKEIIIPKDRSAKVNDTVIKVSSGYINDVKIIMVTNLRNAIVELKEKNYFIYSADLSGKDYKSVSYADKKVLVLGNENKGVSEIVKKESDYLIKIDMEEGKDSLNVGVAAGILIFEARGYEQRQ